MPHEGAVAPSEPRRVIQAETAATLRRLMEGVVLNGTGKLARLDGWTAAGKTGSAQKIDTNTGRYSPTQLIASFTGFAPINNPAITILVSLDSPVGLHEGGMVAAPVFKRIAEQVLPYLDVPRDVPAGQLMQASYKKQAQDNAETLEDFTPSDFCSCRSNPNRSVTRSGKYHRLAISTPSPLTLPVTSDRGWRNFVPDFSGKTMREVTEMCLGLGLDPVLVGSSLATDQVPAAGSQVRRGVARHGSIWNDYSAPAAKARRRQHAVKVPQIFTERHRH